jgi:hypothetical protein
MCFAMLVGLFDSLTSMDGVMGMTSPALARLVSIVVVVNL